MVMDPTLPRVSVRDLLMQAFLTGWELSDKTVSQDEYLQSSIQVIEMLQVGPGTKDYGALSLAVQYYAKPKIVANVPPNCFMPRPKVGSAVIRLERYEKPPVEVKNEKLMFRIIRASFNQRRKTLVNGLKNSQEIPFSKEQIEQALGMCGLSLSVRGEALTLAQFAQLANAFTEIS